MPSKHIIKTLKNIYLNLRYLFSDKCLGFWTKDLLSKYNILFHLMLTCPSFAHPADWAREDVKLSCTKWTKC